MKKLILLVVAFGFFSFYAQSQSISNNAIGLRLGDSDGFGAEISYQRALGTNTRLELDFGWRSSDDWDAIKLMGLYQWVRQLDGNFNWYYGAGAGFGTYDVAKGSNGTEFIIAGNLGLEYDFDFPLLISLDFRPEIGFGNVGDDINFDIAFGIRYQF